MDQERERSGGSNETAASDDGAGPKSDSRLRSAALLIVVVLSFPYIIHAQRMGLNAPYPDGLSVSLSGGAMWPSNATANFYNGSEDNVNTIYRVLHSSAYGPQIWNELTSLNLISAGVDNYTQLQVAEYGKMRYRTAVQLQLGLRYDYPRNNWGWLLNFDYARLSARGVFLIDATNGTGALSNMNRYVTCPISGEEERISIDLGVAKRFRMRSGFDIGVEGGICANNTRVANNDMQIAGRNYNILDLWGGSEPTPYSQEYEYLNQGGIGYGVFGSITYGMTLPGLSSLSVGYSAHYSKIILERYETFAYQQLLYIRLDWAPRML
ncbi:MAG: hypothetical protein SPJ13_06990 [Bacteroidales bacterium]|nr:hypothetical protein [Bacteroidales bacterium]